MYLHAWSRMITARSREISFLFFCLRSSEVNEEDRGKYKYLEQDAVRNGVRLLLITKYHSSLIPASMALSTFATSLYNVSATMKAILWEGTPFSMRVAEVPVPVIQNDTDAIVRVTTAGICGTDLHVYRGTYLTTKQPPWIMGHEAMASWPRSATASTG